MADSHTRSASEPWQVTDEERLRIACRAASIGVWQWDLLTDQMEYSRIAREICGFPAEGPVTLAMAQAVTHPGDIQRTWAQAKRAIDPSVRAKEEFLYRIIRADTGVVRWVKAYGEAQFAVIGDALRAVTFVGSIQDITDEKEREDAVAESAERLQLAIEAGRMAVWEVDFETQAVSGSPELNRLYRFPEDSRPTLEELQSCYAPGEKDRVSREAEQLMAKGETTLNFTIKHAWPDGVEKWFFVRAEVCATRDGSGLRAIGVVGDITDAKKQEERLAVVARELRHRMMNLIAIVGAVANRSWPAGQDEAKVAFQNRLKAIGQATDLMFPRDASEGRVPLTTLVQVVTAAFRGDDRDPFTFHGPEVLLDRSVRNLAMAFHELATNALKYGALSVPEGLVNITWSVKNDGSLSIVWRETAGPPVSKPSSTGLGSSLLTRLLFPPPDQVRIDFEPSGVVCHFELWEA